MATQNHKISKAWVWNSSTFFQLYSQRSKFDDMGHSQRSKKTIGKFKAAKILFSFAYTEEAILNHLLANVHYLLIQWVINIRSEGSFCFLKASIKLNSFNAILHIYHKMQFVLSGKTVRVTNELLGAQMCHMNISIIFRAQAYNILDLSNWWFTNMSSYSVNGISATLFPFSKLVN